MQTWSLQEGARADADGVCSHMETASAPHQGWECGMMSASFPGHPEALHTVMASSRYDPPTDSGKPLPVKNSSRLAQNLTVYISLEALLLVLRIGNVEQQLVIGSCYHLHRVMQLCSASIRQAI